MRLDVDDRVNEETSRITAHARLQAEPAEISAWKSKYVEVNRWRGLRLPFRNVTEKVSLSVAMSYDVLANLVAIATELMGKVQALMP